MSQRKAAISRTAAGVGVTACVLMLAACGNTFREPARPVNVSGPYPNLSSLPSVPSPLLDRNSKNQAFGALGSANAAGVTSQGGLVSAQNARTAPDRQQIAGPSVDEIQNIPANAQAGIAGLQSSAAEANAAVDNKVVPSASAERIQELEQATIAAVRAQREAALRAEAERRNAIIRQQQAAQQAQLAAIQAQNRAIEEQRRQIEQARAEQLAKLTDIPEPKTNRDLFSDKNLEPIAIIYFNEGSTSVNQDDFAVIVEAAQLIRAEGGKIKIVGHSSPPADGVITQENRESNIAVSRARTEAVAREFLRVGVPLSQLELSAAADTQPVFSIRSNRGQSGNRRVEIYRIAPEKG